MRMLQEGIQVIPSHPAHADAGMIEFGIGRLATQTGRQDERRRRAGQRGRLQKLATREPGCNDTSPRMSVKPPAKAICP